MNFTRPPPPQGAPPSYAFVTRVYRRSLRPVVIAASSLAALWCLLWSIGSFRDISIDKGHATRLVVFDIVLGVLYLVACLVEVFGAAAAFTRRLPLIRLYAFLSLGAAVVLTAIQILRVVIHFVFKNDLINECIQLLSGQTFTTRFGIWGPTETDTVSPQDATSFCNDAWSHDSFSEIAWLLVVLILGFLFSSLAFSYYRQMLDPTSAANVSARAPSNQIRMGAFQPSAPFNRPYESGYAADSRGDLERGGDKQYAPPSGPPPHFAPPYDGDDDGAKLPGYGAAEGEGYGKGLTGSDDKKDPFSDFENGGDVAGKPKP